MLKIIFKKLHFKFLNCPWILFSKAFRIIWQVYEKIYIYKKLPNKSKNFFLYQKQRARKNDKKVKGTRCQKKGRKTSYKVPLVEIWQREKQLKWKSIKILILEDHNDGFRVTLSDKPLRLWQKSPSDDTLNFMNDQSFHAQK